MEHEIRKVANNEQQPLALVFDNGERKRRERTATYRYERGCNYILRDDFDCRTNCLVGGEVMTI